MECFNDTFESNKSEAYKFLMSLPVDTVHCSNKSRLTELLEAGLQLASSARPQDCTTAAYLLRMLLSHPLLLEVLPVVQETLKITGSHLENPEVPTLTEEVNPSLAKPPSNGGLANLGLTSAIKEAPGGGNVTYKMIEMLYCMLCDQLAVAEQNLLHAAATGPLYPTLHCIRYILMDTDLRWAAFWGQHKDAVTANQYKDAVLPV